MAVRWQEFAGHAPEIAGPGRAIMYFFGPGLGYLATIRRDGGPRMHPFCPIIHEGGLYGLILPASPKSEDLHRDGRFAIHTYALPDRDDEFYLTGRARRADSMEEAVRTNFLSHGTTTSSGDERCFEFLVERALLALYTKREAGPSWPPEYRKWAANR
jgi:hypothetical protein